MAEENNRDIVEILPKGGENLEVYAKNLLEAAKNINAVVEGVFNDVRVVVPPDSGITVEDVIKIYDESVKVGSLNFGDEKNENETAEEAMNRILKENAKKQIEKLADLNFANNYDIIKWFFDWEESVIFQKKLDISEKDKQKVISTFKEHGFKIYLNKERNFKSNDLEEKVKYIVGRSLYGIETNGLPNVPITYSSFEELFKQN